jgi:tRNA pseudouridine-54 N-methylase
MTDTTTLQGLVEALRARCDDHRNQKDNTGTWPVPIRNDELTTLLDVLGCKAPVLSIMMDGGLIQEVRRLNEAPFQLFVHDHDVEGADECNLITTPEGDEESASVALYDLENCTLLPEGPHWASLRDPIPAQMDDEDED